MQRPAIEDLGQRCIAVTDLAVCGLAYRPIDERAPGEASAYWSEAEVGRAIR